MKQITKILFLFCTLWFTASITNAQCPTNIKINDTISFKIILPNLNSVFIFNYYEYKIFPIIGFKNDTFILSNQNKKDTLVVYDSLFYSDTTVNPLNWKLIKIISNGQIIQCNVPLPVELSYFEPRIYNDKVLLKWITRSETKNSHFIIQKSNGAKWQNIGRIKGHGTTYSKRIYKFRDELKKGVSYYRLKQVDFDGSYSYSKVVAVTNRVNTKNQRVIHLFCGNDIYMTIKNGKKFIKLK